MANDLLQYDQMVEDALRGVIRAALSQVAQHGLPGNHHFYVTFRTDYPGVEMADYLRGKHPHEMTIVLQHQYWGLEVGASAFEITLSFDKLRERLFIPFNAVTGFSDPAVKFGLQFRTPDEVPSLPETPADGDGEDGGGREEEGGGEVITLDSFRKKTREN